MKQYEYLVQQAFLNSLLLFGFCSNLKIQTPSSSRSYDSRASRGGDESSSTCDIAKLDILCQVICECQMFKKHHLVVCKNEKLLEQNLLKSAAACLHKSGKTIHLEFRGSNPLTIPWSQITLKPYTIDKLNLTSSTLSCSCNNAWIFWYKKLDESALVRDLYWPAYDCPQCQTITSKTIFHFPKHLQQPFNTECMNSDSKTLDFQTFIADNCVYPKLQILSSNRNNSDFTIFCGFSSSSDSSYIHHSASQEQGCIEGQVASFFQETNIVPTLESLTSGSPSTCPSTVEYNLTGATVRDSGWLLCTLNSSVLPSAALTRFFIPGSPEILQTLPYKISKKDFRVNFTIASHSPITYSWFYVAKFVRESQEIWEILPNGTDRFLLYNYPSQFLQGWMSEKLVARFSDPDIKCNGGWYYLKACNEIGCAHASFPVNSSRPTGCASLNDTFIVTRIFYYPDLKTTPMPNSSANPQTISAGTNSNVQSPDSNISGNESPPFLNVAIYLATGLLLMAVIGLCMFMASFQLCSWHGSQKTTRTGMKGHQDTSTCDQFQFDDWKSLEGGQLDFMEDNKTYVAWLKSLKENQDIAFIHPSELKVIRQLGEGAFGCVFLVKRSQNLLNFAPTELEKSKVTRGLVRYSRSGKPVVGRSRCLSMECSNISNSSTTPLLKSRQIRSPSATGSYIGSSRPSQTFGGSMFMAMKLLKHINPEKLKDLEREASVLTHLDHPNIVQFYGMTIKGNEEFALLFEYMKFGDLVHYLRDHNPDLINDVDKDDVMPLSYIDLLKISMQVASGLEYLVEKHLVHRDLAARNCLVGEFRTVKLSDFGMTRDLYVTDYYKMDAHTLVPLRWLPPESVLYRKFTTESDVWSLGVLFWEVFSYGQIPWYAYSNSEVMDIVKAGRVLEKPDRCPVEIYKKLILGCCKIKPGERITATDAKETLSDFLEKTVGYCALKEDSIEYADIDRSLMNSYQQQQQAYCCDSPAKSDKSLTLQEPKDSLRMENTIVDATDEDPKIDETFL